MVCLLCNRQAAWLHTNGVQTAVDNLRAGRHAHAEGEECPSKFLIKSSRGKRFTRFPVFDCTEEGGGHHRFKSKKKEMRNLNRVTMIGQLTADPESKETAGGSLAKFGLATNYRWKDDSGEWRSGVDFHNVVAWRGLAEKIAAGFQKGDRVFLEGKLTTRSWETDSGDKRYRTEIVASSVVPMRVESAAEETAETAGVDELTLEQVTEVAA